MDPVQDPRNGPPVARRDLDSSGEFHRTCRGRGRTGARDRRARESGGGKQASDTASITSSIGAELLEVRPAEGVETLLLGVGDWKAQVPSRGTWPLEHRGDPGGPQDPGQSAHRHDLTLGRQREEWGASNRCISAPIRRNSLRTPETLRLGNKISLVGGVRRDNP
jgi:hypothetical protein